jgi:hypothetical protein
MPNLVTVDQANKRLRLDLEADLGDPSGDPGDTDRYDDLVLAIAQASQIVLNYITDPEDYWDADADETLVPGDVSAATLLVVKALYDDQAKAEMLRGIADNDRSNPVVSLLYRRHVPALA